MLFEYAVEPMAIGSSWHNFRYLIEKFGFDRGRLISRFPKKWEREVIEAAQSSGMADVRFKSLVARLQKAKLEALIPSGRSYDPTLGNWLQNALAQQAIDPFHAIIAGENPSGLASVIVAEDADETHPLMVSAHTWEVARTGAALATAMSPLLKSARHVLFVDRYFNIRDPKYRDTLGACLHLLNASGANGIRCELHYCDHVSRPPVEIVEQDAATWLRGIIPAGFSIALYAWNERPGGEDFHARYLLTDLGGMNVESGFAAEGVNQRVQLSLLTSDLVQRRTASLQRPSPVYDLVAPVLEISSDGSVRRS